MLRRLGRRAWLSTDHQQQQHVVFYRAERIDKQRILKQTLFGGTSLAMFAAMEYALYTVPEFPFPEQVPHVGLMASIGYLAWRFKTCRDTVYEMTKTEDGVLGIRGLTLFAQPVKNIAYFHINDLQYHAPGFEDTNAFFYVGVVRGEYFRMFRFEHKDNVERLFKVAGKPTSSSPRSIDMSPHHRAIRPSSIHLHHNQQQKREAKRRVITDN